MIDDDVKAWNYGGYKDPNYGTSWTVKIGKLSLWFSEGQIVAFSTGGQTKVCENVMGPTTERHLRSIDGGNKEARLPYEGFMKSLEETLAEFELVEIARPQMDCLTCGAGRLHSDVE